MIGTIVVLALSWLVLVGGAVWIHRNLVYVPYRLEVRRTGDYYVNDDTLEVISERQFRLKYGRYPVVIMRDRRYQSKIVPPPARSTLDRRRTVRPPPASFGGPSRRKDNI